MSFFTSLGLPEASTSRLGVTIPTLTDEDLTDTHQQQDENPEKVTFASKEIKQLSALRSDPANLVMTRPADTGQEFQLRLAKLPPKIFPEYDMERLINYFQCWVDEWELGHQGLAIDNPNAANLGDVVPPWDFCWTDDYLLDPSVPPLKNIKPRPKANDCELTDELCVNRGCDCEDDECDPRTCSCVKRAAECYPYKGSYYQSMFDPLEPTSRNFAYDATGCLASNIPVGTPIFECNDFCPCADSCRNRVVQKGKKASLAFWKTESKGWGIKAVAAIPAGTFVGAYGGELLNDQEAERRAIVYDQKLGTTYLQSVDSHILKVHLTQQIIEKDLANNKQLQHYRGSPANERRMVELITKTADHIELYEEYFKYLDEKEPVLYDAEVRKRAGKASDTDIERLFAQAKEEAHRRAQQAALRRRERRQRQAALNPATLPPPPPPIPLEEDLNDPVYNFLSLDPNEQDYARTMQMIRSDMEDERFVTVDSALWGNHTRFFNHSCEPNIYHVPVYTNNASIMRPLLAFFTLRQVRAGEELCFSYAGDMGSDEHVMDEVLPSPHQSPSKTPTRSRKPTTIHAPSTKPGAQTVAAITATEADSAAAGSAKSSTVISRLAITCRCGAKNCTGRVFA
ncbi:uncharacterized protein UTRI_06178 [Ustilago trichophora]|uniref:SET domain-containing protein n=1 Tax=Ustilago trichophora TaxID=86804 RepID=A0A5C3EJ15_9BASI|nr:uncharacterized protein UTRI_06178 [Ustilago trichophora]